MKKIIILLLSILIFIPGCYDNIELNKLSIISGIGIDYVDDEYLITYEVINDNKSEDTGDLISDTISGKGKTISEAFSDANNKTSKKDFFAHLKVVIISNNLIIDKLQNITDYLIRDTDIRDEFYLLVSDQISPSDILKHTSKKHPVASEYIVKLLNNEKYNNSLPIKETYQNILAKLIEGKTDIALNSIGIKDDHISLSNTYLFKGYKYYSKLSLHESSLYTMILFNNNGIEYQKDYNGNNFNISICKAKTKFNIDNNVINIKMDLEGKVIENNANLNLKDEYIYNMLNKDFSNIIENDIKNLIKYFQKNDLDALGIQEKYYKSHNSEINDLWKYDDINILVKLKINYKGFIFEVNTNE